VDERQNLSDHEALGFAVWQHCPIAKTEITEKKLLYHDNVSPRVNFNVSCDMTDRLALQINPDQARVAKNLGAAAGVTTYDNYDAEGRIEGGYAFWQTDRGSPEASPYDFMRFDLNTGSIASSTSATGTYSPISLSLPSTTNTYGSYGESVERNQQDYDYKEAKILSVYKYTYDESTLVETNLNIDAVAYGQKLLPSSSYEVYDQSFLDKTSNKIKAIPSSGGRGGL
jgi:hypothetical protein